MGISPCLVLPAFLQGGSCHSSTSSHSRSTGSLHGTQAHWWSSHGPTSPQAACLRGSGGFFGRHCHELRTVGPSGHPPYQRRSWCYSGRGVKRAAATSGGGDQSAKPPLSWWRRLQTKVSVGLPKRVRIALIYLFLSCAAFAVMGLRVRTPEVPYNTLFECVNHPTYPIVKAWISMTGCTFFLEDGRRFFTRWPCGWVAAQEAMRVLKMAKVEIWAYRNGSSMALTLIVFMGYIYTILAIRKSLNMAGNDGKKWADARQQVLRASKDAAAGFKNVAGIDGAKLEVSEVVAMMKDAESYSRVGARVPRGVLLVGPPGSGKTLLARACAAEAGVPFLSAVATEFMEVYVGRGAARVRQLFERASKVAPCIVFIDEIDGLRARSTSGFDLVGASQEGESTLNQLLACMDGLVSRDEKPVIVLAATNRPEILDEALLRPGRFDRIVKVDLPDAQGRMQILQVHLRLKEVPLAGDVTESTLLEYAQRCEGLAGAMLEALVNEAAIRAARRRAEKVGLDDLNQALASYTESRRLSRPVLPIFGR